MKIAILLNDFLIKNNQATTYLIKKISSYVDELFVFTIHDIQENGTFSSYLISKTINFDEDIKEVFFRSTRTKERLSNMNIVLIRTNPARDLDNNKLHERVLDILCELELKGLEVINSPKTLKQMISKKYLLSLPEDCLPKTELVFDDSELLSFFNLKKNKNGIVVKPLVGTRGIGVRRILDKVQINPSLKYPLIAQDFIEDVKQADKRVCLLDGDCLVIDETKGVIKRVPQKGEFRSNVFLGAKVQRTSLNDQELHTLKLLKPWLAKNKLRFVGVDLLGSKVIEINCFSPGGIQDYEKLYQLPFGDYLIGSILESYESEC